MRQITAQDELITVEKVLAINKDRKQTWLNLTGNVKKNDDVFEPVLNHLLQNAPYLFSAGVEYEGKLYFDLTDYKVDDYSYAAYQILNNGTDKANFEKYGIDNTVYIAKEQDDYVLLSFNDIKTREQETAKYLFKCEWINKFKRKEVLETYLDDIIDLMDDEDGDWNGLYGDYRKSIISEIADKENINISGDDLDMINVLSYLVGEFDMPGASHEERAKMIGVEIPEDWWTIYDKMEELADDTLNHTALFE